MRPFVYKKPSALLLEIIINNAALKLSRIHQLGPSATLGASTTRRFREAQLDEGHSLRAGHELIRKLSEKTEESTL